MKQIILDDTDLQLLALLQKDASLSNQALAEQVHVSAPTCLRRIKRLQDSGLIERQMAVLNPEKMAQHIGHGLQALVEVSLERQDAQALAAFEARAVADAEVSICWQVSPGPDFVLVVQVRDMPSYHALVQRLFTRDANVRNVKAFFSVRRSKFSAALALPARMPTAA
jgi:Lrp/AsnC family leucine-responsive transcriptional regulator